VSPLRLRVYAHENAEVVEFANLLDRVNARGNQGIMTGTGGHLELRIIEDPPGNRVVNGFGNGAVDFSEIGNEQLIDWGKI
jgi:hypothetical protein